jgi:hypothetical protein
MKTLAAKIEPKAAAGHDKMSERLTVLEEVVAALAERTELLEASESLHSASRTAARSRRKPAQR